MRSSWRDLACRKSRSAYADHISIIASRPDHQEGVGEAISDYEAIAGVEINQDKLVGLQHGAWKSKSMLSDSVVGHSTVGPVNLLGI